MGEAEVDIMTTSDRCPSRRAFVELLPLSVDLHRHGGQERSVSGVDPHLDCAPRPG